MRTLEGHLFERGYAYRYGGDEYVILLPNADRDSAVTLLKGFQNRLKNLKYREMAEQTTVSIGFCVVDSACYLTEREIEERANRAKNFAKGNGKDCIATFKSSRFLDSELFVVGDATE